MSNYSWQPPISAILVPLNTDSEKKKNSLKSNCITVIVIVSYKIHSYFVFCAARNVSVSLTNGQLKRFCTGRLRLAEAIATAFTERRSIEVPYCTRIDSLRDYGVPGF